MHRVRDSLCVLGCCLVVAAGSASATDLTTEQVATGLTRPLFVTAPPGDTERVFIVEQRGSGGVSTRGDILIMDLASGAINPTPFLSVTGLATADEQGLLGLAFPPDYATSGRFYVNYTASGGSGTTRIARGTVSADPDVANPTLTTILSLTQPFANHNGGWMGFGPDGYLYIATGDGGSGGDPGDRAQNPDVLFGKILRIDVSGDTYSIPPDNPFAAGAGADEVWDYGLRNPWRNCFDRVTGDKYIADVGQGAWEEVNFESASSRGRVNYGWRCREGAHDYTSSSTNPCGSCTHAACPLTDPIHEYAHSGALCSVTGGYVYRGCAIPDLRGTYFFADYYCDFSASAIAPIWSFRYDGSTLTEFTDRTAELDPPGDLRINKLTSFGEDGRGELYICDRDGDVYRIIPDGAVDPPTPNDYDNDGDVDEFDSLRLIGCLGGPGVPYDDCLCDVFDEDTDGDVDLQAFAGFQDAYTG